jgi:hypothetical protein
LGFPRAALTGPPTAAVAVLPLRPPRAVRPCPPTTPAPPAVGNPADSGGRPAVQRLVEHGNTDRSAACCVDKRRLPTLASAPADRCPLTTPHPPARGTRGARCRVPSWPARAPTRRPARSTRRQPPGHRPPPPRRQARAGAVSLPAQCLPPTLTSAPAVHAPPAPGAAPGPSGAALTGLPLAAQTGRVVSRAPRRWSAGAAATGGQTRRPRRLKCQPVVHLLGVLCPRRFFLE